MCVCAYLISLVILQKLHISHDEWQIEFFKFFRGFYSHDFHFQCIRKIYSIYLKCLFQWQRTHEKKNNNNIAFEFWKMFTFILFRLVVVIIDCCRQPAQHAYCQQNITTTSTVTTARAHQIQTNKIILNKLIRYKLFRYCFFKIKKSWSLFYARTATRQQQQ